MRRSIAFIAGMLILASSQAMEVKGLTLGARTDLNTLSAKFGHADCPDPRSFARMDAVLPDMSGTRTLACHVPTTYLGFAGTATIYVDRGFVIKGLVFPIPPSQEDAIAAALEKKYGPPTSRKGDPMELVGVGANGAKQTTMSKDPCTSWKHVQDTSVMVCAGQVTYTYVGSATVNVNDL